MRRWSFYRAALLRRNLVVLGCLLLGVSGCAKPPPAGDPIYRRSATLYQPLRNGDTREVALERARENALLLLGPQICPNCMRFSYNFTTKKTEFRPLMSSETPITLLVEEPKPRELLRITVEAHLLPRSAAFYASLPYERVSVTLREEKILDDPSIVVLRAFRLAYVRGVEIFARKTYGDNIPRILHGFINVGEPPIMQEKDQEVSLDLLVSVAFEK